jgi:DNA-binding PadR family transcriptional regulator
MKNTGWFGFDLNDFFGGGPGGPGGRWRGPRRGFFRPGEVRLALLSLLGDAPGHGYDLMKRLEQRSGGLYQASAGTIYPVLQQLEDEGLVRSRESDGKKVYEITDAGRAEVAAQKEGVDGIWTRAGRWREAGHRMGPDTVEVAAALGRLTKAAFSSCGEEKRTERVVEILNRARTELEQLR